MLDTSAKRLNYLGYPTPGDISEGDRWALAGLFKPTAWSEGIVAATLGALLASFAGTNTSPPGAQWTAADRFRALSFSYPGAISYYDRLEILGTFKFQGDGAITGKLTPTLGALSVSLVGTVTNLTVNGRILTGLGALTSSFRGESYYDHFFDVDYSVTPTFVVTDMPGRGGALSVSLGEIAASLRGSVLPPDSSSGRISATLGQLTALLQGTMTAPAARDGRLHCDLGALSALLRGASVPPQGVVGGIQATLGGAAVSLVGTFTPFAVDGQISVELGSLSANLNGQFIAAGSIVGVISCSLGGASISLRGIAASNIPPTPASRTFRPRRGATTFMARKQGTTKKA